MTRSPTSGAIAGCSFHHRPSRPFRTASLSHCEAADRPRAYFDHLHQRPGRRRCLARGVCGSCRRRSQRHPYFLEVFNPNVERALTPKTMPQFVNDAIIRCLAGLTESERPKFLKIAYNGPRALEESASFDPGLVGKFLAAPTPPATASSSFIRQKDTGAGRAIWPQDQPWLNLRSISFVSCAWSPTGPPLRREGSQGLSCGAAPKKGHEADARDSRRQRDHRISPQAGSPMSERRGVLSAGTWCVDFNKSIARWPDEDTSNEVLAIDRQNGGSGLEHGARPQAPRS